MTVETFTFTPADITVARDTTVTWTDNHHVEQPVTASDNSFRSKALETGVTFSSYVHATGHLQLFLFDPDVSYLRRPSQYDTMDQIVKSAKVDQTFYVPGEHDTFADNGNAYPARFGEGTKGNGWRSFDYNGVHVEQQSRWFRSARERPVGVAEDRSRTAQREHAARRTRTFHFGHSIPTGGIGCTCDRGQPGDLTHRQPRSDPQSVAAL